MRCTLASSRRTMILSTFPRIAGNRFRLLKRGASIDAGVGVCMDRLLPSRQSLKRYGSHPAASSKTSTLGGTQAVTGMDSICGPTISGAHISHLQLYFGIFCIDLLFGLIMTTVWLFSRPIYY